MYKRQLRKLDEDTLLAVFEGVPQFEISRDVLTGGVKAVDLFVDNAAVFEMCIRDSSASSALRILCRFSNKGSSVVYRNRQ